MIRFFVKGQAMTPDAGLIVADTLDYLAADFVFLTADWQSYNKWAHFRQGKTVWDIALEDNAIQPEKHLNLSAGEWEVYLHGANSAGKRITTDICKISVKSTGILNGKPLPDIPESVAEQVDNAAKEALRIAKEANAKAEDSKPYADAAKESATAAISAQVAAAKSEIKAKEQAEFATAEANRATSNILNGVQSHNDSPESHPFILGEVSRVESIAKGRNFAEVFDTRQDMETWLADPENVKTLEVGTNLYIRELNVPDFWWDGESAQELEVESPDLSPYVTKIEFSMSLPMVLSKSEYEKLESEGKLEAGRIYYVVPDEVMQ